MARLTAMAGLVPVGFQTMTLSNSTAVALNSTLQANANVLHVSVETNSARYRVDGTDPTLTTGVLIGTGVLYQFEGVINSGDWKFQRSTGTCTISIMGFEQPGARN